MSDDAEGSVTRLIGALAADDSDEAARGLWERYFDQIVRLARSRLGGSPRGHADEEDAALSAFASLCRGVSAGRFPYLSGRDDLWKLLATITARKVADQLQRQHRLKRGGGRVVGESDVAPGDDRGGAGLDAFAGDVATPAFLAQIAEEVCTLFGRLPEESLRVVALLRLEGYSNEEIATSLDCAVRSVERKLERIRLLWTVEAPGA